MKISTLFHLLSFVYLTNSVVYDSSANKNLTPTFVQTYLFKTAKTNFKFECLTICKQDENCKSLAYDASTGFCYQYNTTFALNSTNTISTSGVSLYVKRTPLISKNKNI
jgi:hypothetical protein